MIEIACDLGRPRGDVWEAALWESTLAVRGRDIFCSYVVHNKSIVVPENIDAARALSGTEADPAKSMAATDAALGIRQRLP